MTQQRYSQVQAAPVWRREQQNSHIPARCSTSTAGTSGLGSCVLLQQQPQQRCHSTTASHSNPWNAWQCWDPAPTNTQTYPNAEKGADRLVVTGLEVHVAAVPELVDVPSSPQDPIAPCWDTTLPTAKENRLPGESNNPIQAVLLPNKAVPSTHIITAVMG